ncbi:MAG: tetratricopeptide repeat protein [Alphaproteobacteria bacterium]|jgi:hypothetical protein|nr:tetratricopeptide repeat protein [Candidatus Jidaibacter sp.]
MSDLAREIKEELREEKVFHFLKDNARYFMIFAVCLVVFSSLGLWYKSYSKNQVYKDGSEYLTAVIKMQAGNMDEGLKKFEDLRENSSNYAAIANLNVAAFSIYGKQYAKAAAALDDVISNSSYDKILRDLAAFYKIVVNLESGNKDKQYVIQDLQSYIKADSVYSLNAREVLATLYISEKKFDLAKEQLNAIQATENAPQTLLGRVKQYNALLNN